MTALTLSSDYPDVKFKSSKEDHMETCFWGNKGDGEYKQNKKPSVRFPNAYPSLTSLPLVNVVNQAKYNIATSHTLVLIGDQLSLVF